MILDKATLLLLDDILEQLNKEVGLKDETIHDVRVAIGVKLRIIKYSK